MIKEHKQKEIREFVSEHQQFGLQRPEIPDFELKQANVLRTAKEIISDQKITAPIARFVERSVQCVVFGFTESVATGDGKFYFHVDKNLDAHILEGVHAEVITAGISGTTTIQLNNTTQAVDLLSTALSIDSGETGSDTAATPAVIDTKNAVVAKNDLLRVDVDAIASEDPAGLIISMNFRKK